ncbi:MAG: hypothetical protein ABWK05_04135 [Pyrobaculum sp.]
MDEFRFSVRKSDFDKFVERLGLSPEEVLSELKAEVVKVGPGFRYVIDMEHFFFYVLAKLNNKPKPVQQKAVDQSVFEQALNKAIDQYAGASGYAKLIDVKNAVVHELGITDEEFVKKLAELVQSRKGAYVLLEGGDVKIQIGAKKYGYIKRVARVAEVVYY